MWGVLKNLLPKRPSSDVSGLEIGDRLVTTAKDMANEFNSFFINIGKTLADKITTRTNFKTYLQKVKTTHQKFKFSAITSEDVFKLLSGLKTTKATGLDNISASLLKTAALAISGSLAHLFNLSLSSEKVPIDWKCAKVSAVFKKGSKLYIGNYRPISVLPIISKVLEKLVHNQIYSFLSENNLLCADPSGFRQQHSTQTRLHSIMDDVCHSTDGGGLVVWYIFLVHTIRQTRV